MSQVDGLSSTDASNQCGGSLEELIVCPECPQVRFFKGQRGLKIHKAKAHKTRATLSQPNVSNGQTNVIIQDDLGSNHTSQPFWQFLSKSKSSVPVIKRIPRGARISVARKLSEIFKNILDLNNRSAWESLFAFSFKILHADLTDRHTSLTQKIKNNCLNPLVISTSCCFNNPKLHAGSVYKIVENKVSDGDTRGGCTYTFFE